MDQKEFSVFVKRFLLVKKSTGRYYSAFPLSKTSICQWFIEFKCYCICTEDAAHSVHPNEASILESTKKIHHIVSDGCKLKVRKMTDSIKMSTKYVRNILNIFLGNNFELDGCHIFKHLTKNSNRLMIQSMVWRYFSVIHEFLHDF